MKAYFTARLARVQAAVLDGSPALRGPAQRAVDYLERHGVGSVGELVGTLQL